MNKQFDKLMYDAGMTAQGCWDEWDSYQRGAIAKFAELIVSECADIAKHHVMNISTYADAEFVEEQIAKHFGVEE